LRKFPQLSSKRLFWSLARWRRRHRWIAIWALCVMLFNQVALARHLCAGDPPPLPTMSAHCCPGSQQPHLPSVADLGCTAHCQDANKLGKDPQALTVPPLPIASIPMLWAAPPRLASQHVASYGPPAPSDRCRRPQTCSVWLI
jgi:hypothetical protein